MSEEARKEDPRKKRTVHLISPRHGQVQKDYAGQVTYLRTRFGNLVKVRASHE